MNNYELQQHINSDEKLIKELKKLISQHEPAYTLIERELEDLLFSIEFGLIAKKQIKKIQDIVK